MVLYGLTMAEINGHRTSMREATNEARIGQRIPLGGESVLSAPMNCIKRGSDTKIHTSDTPGPKR